MNSASDSTIGCPHCHKRFVWKASLGGMAVRCTCGEVFAFPASPDSDLDASSIEATAKADELARHYTCGAGRVEWSNERGDEGISDDPSDESVDDE